QVGPLIGEMRAAGRDSSEIPELRQVETLKGQIQVKERDLKEVEDELDDQLLHVPNLYHESVPIGEDETGNVEVRSRGERPSFDFEPKPHYEIGERLGIMDFERAGRVA